MTTTLTVKLQGLCCSNCANKIEKRTSKIKDVSNVQLNFAQSKMKIDCPSIKKEFILDQIKKIVKALEPDVQVYEISAPIKDPMPSELFAIVESPDLNDATKEKEDHDGTHQHLRNTNHNKKRLTILFTSLILFFIGLFAIQYEAPQWVVFILFGIGYVLVGSKVVKKSFNNIRHGEIFDENFLMTIASLGAIGLGEYPEAVAVMIFYEIGEYFQDLAVGKSRQSIASLINIKPTFANLLKDDTVTTVTPESLKINDVIVVKPGESIPVDGKIIEGHSSIDASALTGESIPMDVDVNDNVLSGSININKVIKVKVEKTYENSTVSRILDLVENASGQKSKTENFITKFASIYTPIVVILALLIAFMPIIFFNGDPSQYIYSALIFLVISCPCALVVSVPLGFYSGIGNASKHGVLVKGGNYLEALNSIDTILFDKTGTLTKGNFGISQIIPYNHTDELDVLMYASIGESHSNHPIGKAIIKHYNNKKTDYMAKNKLFVAINDLTDISHEEISGHGVKVIYDNHHILIGNEKLLKDHHIFMPEMKALGTLVNIALDNQYIGTIVIEDEIKPDSKIAVQALKAMSFNHIAMLTGDNERTAEDVAKRVGIDHFKANLLPEDKYNYMLSKKGSGKSVAFIGDGINDAPVLAASDVGISMGGIGSDIAIEASDIVLMTDEPSSLVSAIKIARKTKTIVMQNIVLALSTKILIMGLSIIGIGTMWTAIFADVGIALLAVLNATRVLHFKPNKS